MRVIYRVYNTPINNDEKSKHNLNSKPTSMLASMEKPQAQIRAKPRETMRPTQSPMDMSSPHSHIGPNLPRFTSNTYSGKTSSV